MRFRSLSAAAVLVLALIVVGAAAARPSVTRATTVKVTAKDFSSSSAEDRQARAA